MKTEKEQLLNKKLKGGVFVVESEDRLKKWRLALAQRYSQANVINRNIQIKCEGDVDDPVIKIKMKEGMRPITYYWSLSICLRITGN